MKRFRLPLIFAVAAAAMFSCGKKSAPAEEPVPEVDTVAPAVPDSTIYGVAAESGMSTLYLVTREGDTIVMERTGEDGMYSKMYGYITEGDSFAVTKRGNADDGYALTTGYNLTLLSRFDVDFAIRNGLFVVDGTDTVEIETLTSDSLVVAYASGERKAFAPRAGAK